MTLLRSTPRQVYRIYSEEEFFAAEDWQADAQAEFALSGQEDPRREPRQWGRFAALAALASVVAAIVGVVALNAPRSGSGSDRRFADVGLAQLRTRARPPRGRPREIVAGRLSIRPLDAGPPKGYHPGSGIYWEESPKHARRASASVRRVAERRPRPAGRLPSSAPPYLPPQPAPAAETPVSVPAGAVTVSAEATARIGTAGTGAAGTATAGTGTAGTGAAGTANAGTAAARTATAAVGGARSEFGFERR